MAKTARKKSAAKAKKATKRPKAKVKALARRPKAKTKAKAPARTKTKPKASAKKPPARKAKPKAKPKGIMGSVASAIFGVAEVIEEAQALRNKMEPPGRSEDL
jgi:hypothetical protein